MNYAEILKVCERELLICDLAYRWPRAADERHAASVVFANSFLPFLAKWPREEGDRALRESFARHIRESPRFPTPANIIALLECFRRKKRTRPNTDEGERTPGIGEVFCRAVLGDAEARREVENFMSERKAKKQGTLINDKDDM